MPKSIDKLIGQLEELYKKLEYEFEDYGGDAEEGLVSLNESIDALAEINNELDSDMEEE